MRAAVGVPALAKSLDSQIGRKKNSNSKNHVVTFGGKFFFPCFASFLFLPCFSLMHFFLCRHAQRRDKIVLIYSALLRLDFESVAARVKPVIEIITRPFQGVESIIRPRNAYV